MMILIIQKPNDGFQFIAILANFLNFKGDLLFSEELSDRGTFPNKAYISDLKTIDQNLRLGLKKYHKQKIHIFCQNSIKLGQ